jgi:hypothetical protein
MKRYMVSLDVGSHTLTLDEISRRMGAAPSPGSHDKGDLDHRGSSCFLGSLWRLDSNADDAATIEDHCRSLGSRLPRGQRPQDDDRPADLEIWLRIGVMYDTYCLFHNTDSDVERG